jgi:hypothetical protein
MHRETGAIGIAPVFVWRPPEDQAALNIIFRNNDFRSFLFIIFGAHDIPAFEARRPDPRHEMTIGA